jgi:hypothetical protein
MRPALPTCHAHRVRARQPLPRSAHRAVERRTVVGDCQQNRWLSIRACSVSVCRHVTRKREGFERVFGSATANAQLHSYAPSGGQLCALLTLVAGSSWLHSFSFRQLRTSPFILFKEREKGEIKK